MESLIPQKVLNIKKELEKKAPKLQGDYILTEKFDGWYVQIPFSASLGTWGFPLSSANRVIPSLMWTTVLFNQLPKPKEDCYLIAEAIREDTPFHITNGLLNRSIGDYAFKDVIFKLHDIVYPGKYNSAFVRYIYLKEFIKETDQLHVVPIIAVAEYKEKLWKGIFETIVNNGGEGLIAKKTESTFSPGKRNSDLLKIKLECEIDALAVRLEEGYGAKGNDSLILVSKRKNGIIIRTNIGKHTDKALFRKDESNIIGKVVTLKGMEELHDGQLRQPTFYCVRDDKKVTDYE